MCRDRHRCHLYQNNEKEDIFTMKSLILAQDER